MKIEDELELGHLFEKRNEEKASGCGTSPDHEDETRHLVIMKRKGVSMDSKLQRLSRASRQRTQLAAHTSQPLLEPSNSQTLLPSKLSSEKQDQNIEDIYHDALKSSAAIAANALAAVAPTISTSIV